MHQLAAMDDQFCVVPFWDIPSIEADNLLSDYYDESSAAFRCPNNLSKVSTRYLLDDDLDGILEQAFTSTAEQNDEGRLLCSLDGECDKPGYYDGSDISWLNEFMNIYGITTLDSNDDFNMKSINTVVTTPQAKANHSTVVLTPMEEMKSDEILIDKCTTQLSTVPDNVSMMSFDVCTAAGGNMFSVRKTNTARKSVKSVMEENDKTTHSSAVEVVDGNIHEKSSIVSVSDHRQKLERFAINRTLFDGISERKREQNRCAAIRYRGKRREEVKQMKQELHKLELRNTELKTEMNWLEKEVTYLKSLMKLTKSL
uniref:BZIP domain-containing protein n=2 Tax=Wuchereria bancrofti TaxID=6293 RepID=A0AAF5PV85_WUCBA